MDVQELRLVLTVPDFDAALRFYRDALGLPLEADLSTPQGSVVLLEAGRATIELTDEGHAAEIDAIEVGRRVAGPIRVAFRVTDSAAKGRELESAGGKIVAPRTVTPWGDANVRLDAPDGTQLTLFTPIARNV
jgi:catechol 2,3-dioxygenase-like lactoylglutathione lyase family enzyme